ncbi:Type III restriction enzyme, res subunit [uncultured archaeon]|nr:Type III restriction enzyme, res subunit [uncultured archaeon]
MSNLSEAETRKKLIDPILERVGWKIGGHYVKEEVNPVKSKFNTREYIGRETEIERGVDRFIDYLLLDEDRSPAAIIESKKTSVDVEKGEIQARTYREDIEKQIGIKIPIFLTNGHKWYYVDDLDIRRQVLLPFSQKDIHRIISLKRKDPSNSKINSKIVDRRRGVEAVKLVLEHFSKGHREALINMATGTGKTRVAMAIIDGLIKADYIQKVLFVVDRISLGNQAKEKGFKKFFPDSPICELNEEGYSDSARFYVSTVQTLMSQQKPRGKFYEKFGTGAFDLIIFDEAHRSYYDRNNDIFKYFDCLKIGLTATPSSEDSKDTFELFGCEKGKPTVKYDYWDAVNEKDLAPYVADIIETKVLSLGIDGKKLSKELQQALKIQEEEPEKFQTPGSKFEKFFTDEKTNELIIREFIDRCYKSDDNRPCKSIFFCASVRHAEALEILFQRLYPTLAKDVKVITSDKSRYMDEVKRFQKRDNPRVALSVGVLDTGVDVPEVMNLVFVKPVISPIRFWQMLGRGTRNLSACENKEWLPTNIDGQHIKEDFLILDFKFGDWSNVLEHKLNVIKKRSSGTDAKTRIFLEQVDTLEKKLSDKERKIVEKQILDTVKEIDIESPLVIEKKDIIKKVISAKFDLVQHVKELREEIAPLLIYSPSENSKVYSFISKCVKLFDYIKENKKDKIADVEEFVIDRVESIWDKNLEAIKQKRDDLIMIQKEQFWEEITFGDVDFLVREISPLMIFYEEERKNMLKINAPDTVIDVKKELMEKKDDKDFINFIENNPLIKKIKDGEGVTSKELLEIEIKLKQLNPSFTIENIQQTKDFVLFLRELIQVKGLPDPQEMIKWEFDKFVADKNQHYNSEQLKFLRFLEQVFVRSKHIELKDLAEHPLADARPLDMFTKEQLEIIVQKCNKLKWK